MRCIIIIIIKQYEYSAIFLFLFFFPDITKQSEHPTTAESQLQLIQSKAVEQVSYCIVYDTIIISIVLFTTLFIFLWFIYSGSRARYGERLRRKSHTAGL
jgi:hypothetical protein